MGKTVILFSPSGGSVHRVAQVIQEIYADAECIALENFDVERLSEFDNFILGGSTVGADTWQDANTQNHWSRVIHDMEAKDIRLEGKKAAVFGLGNQVLYPDHFVDSMITIRDAFAKRGAEIFGEWSVEDYDFTDSKSVIDDHFVGLALDEDNEDELTEERCREWVALLKTKF